MAAQVRRVLVAASVSASTSNSNSKLKFGDSRSTVDCGIQDSEEKPAEERRGIECGGRRVACASTEKEGARKSSVFRVYRHI